MKRNSNFLMSKVARKYVLVPIGKEALSFNGIISINDMGAFIWELLEKETTAEDIAKAIVTEYDVETEDALEDVNKFLNVLRESGCLEE